MLNYMLDIAKCLGCSSEQDRYDYAHMELTVLKSVAK